jgi:hypothetical protein
VLVEFIDLLVIFKKASRFFFAIFCSMTVEVNLCHTHAADGSIFGSNFFCAAPEFAMARPALR